MLACALAGRRRVDVVRRSSSLGLFMLAWTVNVVLIATYMRMLKGRRIELELIATWRPLLSSQLAHAIATAVLAYFILHVGAAAIVLGGILILTFSRLQRDLLEAERVRDEAQERSEQLAAANERLRRSHFGAMRSLVRSIHLHDHMTARHSAAVARYARAIARAAGCSKAEQDLVHTAGLLHDVGKHILTDAILKGDTQARRRAVGARQAPPRGGRAHRPAARGPRRRRRDHPRPPRAHRRPRLSARARRRRDPAPVADDLDRRHVRRDDRARLLPRPGLRRPRPSPSCVASPTRSSTPSSSSCSSRTSSASRRPAFGHGDDADFEQELALDGRAAEAPADVPVDAGEAPGTPRAAARLSERPRAGFSAVARGTLRATSLTDAVRAMPRLRAADVLREWGGVPVLRRATRRAPAYVGPTRTHRGARGRRSERPDRARAGPRPPGTDRWTPRWCPRSATTARSCAGRSTAGASRGAQPGAVGAARGHDLPAPARRRRSTTSSATPPADPHVRDLPAVREGPIGAYIGVPVTIAAARLYVLCCLAARGAPRPRRRRRALPARPRREPAPARSTARPDESLGRRAYRA